MASSIFAAMLVSPSSARGEETQVQAGAGESITIRVRRGTERATTAVETRQVAATLGADGDLRVTVPRDSIPADAWCVEIVPAFMTARKGDAGYWLQARGTYGRFDKAQGTYVKDRQLMPIYGVKKGDVLWAGHVKTWRFDYDFTTVAKDGVYETFPRFRCDRVRRFFPSLYNDIVVDFRRFTGERADYNGLAKAYRAYQLGRGAVRTIADRLKDQPELDYLCDALVVRIQTHASKPIPDKRDGYAQEDFEPGKELPVQVHMPFGVCEEYLQAFKDAGIDKLSFCSAGWGNGGYDGRVPGHFPVCAEAGGEAAFRRLIAKAKELGYQFAVHCANTDGYTCSPMWNDGAYACRTADGRPDVGGLWGGGRCRWICQRCAWDFWTRGEMDRLAGMGLRGPHYIDVYSATYPARCAHPAHPCTPEQTADWQNRILAYARRTFGAAASESGYDHVIGNLDYINYIERDLKTEHEGGFAGTLVSGVFPLWELVYHGIVLYTSDRLTQNHTRGKCLFKLERSGDPRWMIGDGVEDPYTALKIVEFGGRPIFYTYRFADVPRVKKAWEEFVPVRHLQRVEMTRHDTVAPDVFLTTFADGSRIVSNYRKTAYDWNGTTVKPMDYVLVRPDPFVAASATWPAGLSTNVDTFVTFEMPFDWKGPEKPVLRLTAASAYRATLNGAFVGYGPARTTLGWSRVDEWPLEGVKPGKNRLRIDVAGYYRNSMQYVRQASFLRAEVMVGGRVLGATPRDCRAWRISRTSEDRPYSQQRQFACETYTLPEPSPAVLPLAPVASPILLPREVPYPDCSVNDGFVRRAGRDGKDLWEAPAIDTGFPMVDVTVTRPGRLVLTFDEALKDGAVDPLRNGDTKKGNPHSTVGRTTWNLTEPGTYALETFEPYSLKYAAVRMETGAADVKAVRLRRYRNPEPLKAKYAGKDPLLAKIFRAAQQSLSQNATDIFMDCPGRERSGWLCDTWFSAQAYAALGGDTSVERCYLENFARATADDPRPVKSEMRAGYPCPLSITTWTMWYEIQCRDCVRRLPPEARTRFKALVKNRILANVLYLDDFTNKDGLLEDLPGWTFVEWSHANDLTKGVNYPVNMLWAMTLDAVDELYGRPDLARRARAIRAKVREQSFDGTWFHDQALRGKDGRLVRVADRTETCQYYAFFTDTVSRETHGAFWERLVARFGPGKKNPDGVFPADMFFGYMLRLVLLDRFGRKDLVEEEIKARVGYQAEESGTLWEFRDGHDSRCHAFPSFVSVFLPKTRE